MAIIIIGSETTLLFPLALQFLRYKLIALVFLPLILHHFAVVGHRLEVAIGLLPKKLRVIP